MQVQAPGDGVSHFRSNRIPALDGWRGIAILLVLFGHIQDSLLRHYYRPWTQTEGRGVSLFFVLSGFLITSKLLETRSLKRFYVRRFFRLIPAAWTYLAAMVYLTVRTGHVFTTPREVVSCVFFFRNFFGLLGEAGHFWSLSIEEQFYLTWPWILLLAGKRRGLWIGGIAAVVSAALSLMFWNYLGRVSPVVPTPMAAHALLVGCFFALLLSNHMVGQWVTYLTIPAIMIALGCVLLFPKAQLGFVEEVCVGLLMAGTTLYPGSPLSRLVAFRPLAWIGTVSYSVYIWQEVFMPYHSALVLCVVMPLAAMASYYLIERPCTRLGHQITGKG